MLLTLLSIQCIHNGIYQREHNSKIYEFNQSLTFGTFNSIAQGKIWLTSLFALSFCAPVAKGDRRRRRPLCIYYTHYCGRRERGIGGGGEGGLMRGFWASSLSPLVVRVMRATRSLGISSKEEVILPSFLFLLHYYALDGGGGGGGKKCP